MIWVCVFYDVHYAESHISLIPAVAKNSFDNYEYTTNQHGRYQTLQKSSAADKSMSWSMAVEDSAIYWYIYIYAHILSGILQISQEVQPK